MRSTRTIIMIGGSGFVGRQIIAKLANSDFTIKVMTRNPQRHIALTTQPNVQLIGADVHDFAILDEHFASADVVINFVGVLNNSRSAKASFNEAHIKLSEKIVDACIARNVPRFLHMSSLHANDDAPSEYLRSKAASESYVHSVGGDKLACTSFQPSVIFGDDDSFLNRFASVLSVSPPIFPLACPHSKFAPVYVGDVADAFINAIDTPSTFGQSIRLVGPKEYTLKQLVEYVAELKAIKRTVIGLPNALAILQGAILQFAPGKPFTLDNYHSLQVDSTCAECDPCLTSLESIAPRYLGGNNKLSKFQKFREIRFS